MAKTSTKRKPKARAKTPLRKSAARRPVKAAAKTRAKAKKPRKQTFVASHLVAGAFEQGLRRYAQYRDLGI